MMRIRQN